MHASGQRVADYFFVVNSDFHDTCWWIRSTNGRNEGKTAVLLFFLVSIEVSLHCTSTVFIDGARGNLISNIL